MTKRLKAFIALFAAFAVLLPCVLFYAPQRDAANTASDFLRQLREVYQAYDVPENAEGEYACARLLVSGWDGKGYGAKATAYDRENDFAVLQYTSPEKAQRAADIMNQSGMVAEPDGPATLDAAPCTLSPAYSEALGVPAYLENYAMPYDDVIVAVIDTGVMLNHEALAGRLVSNGTDVSADALGDADYDELERGEYFGHGTFVSSVIADNTPENVKILPIKAVTFETEETTVAAMVAGINYAVAAGADVINISLGTVFGQNAFEKAISSALAKGICVCASAGNGGEEIAERYPACIDGVITVSALDAACENPADYTNYGACVDFCAPGYRVYGAYPAQGASSYRYWSGTSFSAPYVSALCADIKSVDTAVSRDDVVQLLSDFTEDKGVSGRDDYCGLGMPHIDAVRYEKSGVYDYEIPQGTLHIHGAEDYTEATQPWRAFASSMVSVTVDKTVSTIGNYAFYNMRNADFTIQSRFAEVGDYAFYGCDKLKKMRFGRENTRIGYKAFTARDGFRIYGYRNTPAETYAVSEGIRFVSLGCKHHYLADSVESESGNYTLYTCAVCGDSYRGEYIAPTVLESGACGENAFYTLYKSGKLVISGSGALYDYTETRAPWYENRGQIAVLEIRNGITALSPFAFYGCNGIVKIRLEENSASFTTDGKFLLSADGTELLLTVAAGAYALPQSVTTLRAEAFIAAPSLALTGNDTLRVNDSLIYDANGNILAALPAYRNRVLTLNDTVIVKENAFLLTEYPERVESDVVDGTLQARSVGYVYRGSIEKQSLIVCACRDSGAGQYALQNGFTLEETVFRCGDNVTYTYDETAHRLTISGIGAMNDYAKTAVPWYGAMSEIYEVEITDGVTAISDYAFYGAEALKHLTMPLSLRAPQNDTVWNGVTGLLSVHLTYGSGRMDDYVNGSGVKLYSFTPWYISRATITDFSLDENALYIGKSAFRGCSALTSATLQCVEEIGEDAFLACPKLRDFTILSKNAVLPDYCIQSYMTNTRKIYPGFTVRGYSDSTLKDYCERLGAGFVSVGCGHSRNVTLESTESGDLSVLLHYVCNDCGEQFTEIVDLSCTVQGRVLTLAGLPVPDAVITVGDSAATTDANGVFTLRGVAHDNYPVAVKLYGTTLFTDTVTLASDVTVLNVQLRYADFIADGTVNAKDYAYALQNGFDEWELFDYGTINEGDNSLTVVNE